MGLAADSTFEDVVLDTIADYVPTDTDLEGWVELDPATDDDIVTTSTGLLGADLTTFNENCAVASDNCDVADYEKYSGWAIGIKWTAADADRLRQATDEQSSTVIFADTSRLVECYWADTNEIWNADVEVDPSEDAPADEDTDLTWEDDASTSPFDGAWFGELLGLEDQEQLAITFQEEGADVYYEVGDTATLWVHKDFADGVETEVTWAGAAQLTAAASVIVASLLF